MRQRLALEAIEILQAPLAQGLNGTGLIRLKEILKELGLDVKAPLMKIHDQLFDILNEKGAK